MRAFAEALDSVPMALAENSGLSPIETLANIKSRQAKEKNSRLGVDCMQTGSNGTWRSLFVLLSILVSIVQMTCRSPPYPLATSSTTSTTTSLVFLFVAFLLHRRWLLLAAHAWSRAACARPYKPPLLTPPWDALRHGTPRIISASRLSSF
jgi:hypothetical protein